jgi:hypothetical protein
LTPDGVSTPNVLCDSVLAPTLVTQGRTTFYSATWKNVGTPTLTNPVVTITLPAGASAVPAPPGCTMSPSSLVITCPRGNLASGASLTQQLLVTAPGAAATNQTITAVLTAKEAGNDQNKSHVDSFQAPARTLQVVSTDADAAGACLRGNAQVATRPNVSAANPLTTTAGLAGSIAQVCAPVTVQERAGNSPTEGCGTGLTCTTDIAVTDFFPLASEKAPVQLTFTVVGTNKNMTWFKTGANGVPVQVADCPGATSLPAGVDACVNSRAKLSSTSLQFGILWRAGADPTWRGR